MESEPIDLKSLWDCHFAEESMRNAAIAKATAPPPSAPDAENPNPDDDACEAAEAEEEEDAVDDAAVEID